jgi:DNA-binding response OmpR family regulator
MARRRSYDLLLCDLNLSSGGTIVNGAGAAELVCAASGSRKPVVVFMTGDLLELHNGNGEGNRTDTRRLQKPFRISEVLALLRQIDWNAPTDTRVRD